MPFQRDGRDFLLVDTAGVRRRARVDDAVERASIAKTLQAIAEAHVVVMTLDAHEGIGEQDASVLGQALERGRVLLIAINKWDGIAMDQREQIRHQLALKLDFVPFAPLHFISARHGTGVGELARDVIRGYDVGDARDADAGADAHAGARAAKRISRRWCAAGASSCATRTRADAIRRAS